MAPKRAAFLLVLVPMLLSACGLVEKGLLSFKRKKPAEATQAQDVFIGIVESVNPEQKFVLVRMDVRVAVAAGTRLETRPQKGMKAVLMATPERKQSFVSADIVDGLPAPGDLVVIPPGAVPLPVGAPAVPGTEPATSQPLPSTAPSTTVPDGGLPPPVG